MFWLSATVGAVRWPTTVLRGAETGRGWVASVFWLSGTVGAVRWPRTAPRITGSGAGAVGVVVSIEGAVSAMACGAGSVAIGCAAVVESEVAVVLLSEAVALSDVATLSLIHI